jgi:hypothetical protein
LSGCFFFFRRCLRVSLCFCRIFHFCLRGSLPCPSESCLLGGGLGAGVLGWGYRWVGRSCGASLAGCGWRLCTPHNFLSFCGLCD